LEARAPYLDRELVQYASSLPRKYKTNIFSSKTILRSLFKELLPETILKRKKHGFTLPINEWLKDSENPVMKKYFSYKKILSSRFFNRNAVEHLLLQHRSNTADCTRQLWNILTFYIWTEQNDII
ncbi:hypothetical protein KDK77_09640, partial [bacterium]|nr:hypothetical protein [bacterium]